MISWWLRRRAKHARFCANNNAYVQFTCAYTRVHKKAYMEMCTNKGVLICIVYTMSWKGQRAIVVCCAGESGLRASDNEHCGWMAIIWLCGYMWLRGYMWLHGYVEVWLVRSLVHRMPFSCSVGDLWRQSVIVANSTIGGWEADETQREIAWRQWLPVCARI